MKRILFLLTALIAASSVITAQSRTFTRGAEAGELYLTNVWYGIYAGGPFMEELRNAIVRFTENGKKAEIVFDQDWFAFEYNLDLMQPRTVIADATPGVLYNIDNNPVTLTTRLWISYDHGKNWELRDENSGRKYYYAANVEGVIYRTSIEGANPGSYKSLEYGKTFIEMEDGQRPRGEEGLKECEFFYLTGWGLHHTNDCYKTYIDLTACFTETRFSDSLLKGSSCNH
jgi:hypothetical protein